MIFQRMNPVHTLVFDRIQSLVSRARLLERGGNDSTACFLLEEAKQLAQSVDDEAIIMVMPYHRYFSDSFGVVFEVAHGDPELMFGGVV